MPKVRLAFHSSLVRGCVAAHFSAAKSTSAVKSAVPGSTNGSWSWWFLKPYCVNYISIEFFVLQCKVYSKSVRLVALMSVIDHQSNALYLKEDQFNIKIGLSHHLYKERPPSWWILAAISWIVTKLWGLTSSSFLVSFSCCNILLSIDHMIEQKTIHTKR